MFSSIMKMCRLQKAVEDLKRRKTARPRTVKTLMSTLHATLGKELPGEKIDEICRMLIQQGYVKPQGTKVSYAFPEHPEVPKVN